MTTSGAVANSPSAPSKAPAGLRPGSSTKDEPAAGKEGFGDVLSGLENTDEDSNKAPAAKSGARSGTARGVLGRHSQTVDPAPRPDAAADALALLQDDLLVAVDAEQDANTTLSSPAAAATTTDGTQASLAVIAALNAASRGSAANAVDTPVGEPHKPNAEVETLDAVDGGAAKPPVPSVVAKDGVVAETAVAEANTARTADPNIARIAATANGVKEKQGSKGDFTSVSAPGTAEIPTDLETDENVDIVRNTRANVVRQEVHFAPVAEPVLADGAEQGTFLIDGPQLDLGELGSGNMRPAQQVAQRIVSEAALEPAFARHLTGADQPIGKPALKILQIQLRPADLGTVTVRMEMKNADLVLHVEADRAATADMIRSDQDSLSKLLRASGYNVDASSIRVVEGDRGAAGQQNNQQGGGHQNLQSQAQSHPGASHRDGSAQQRSNGPTTGGDAQQARRNEIHATTTPRTGSGLYL